MREVDTPLFWYGALTMVLEVPVRYCVWLRTPVPPFTPVSADAVTERPRWRLVEALAVPDHEYVKSPAAEVEPSKNVPAVVPATI